MHTDGPSAYYYIARVLRINNSHSIFRRFLTVYFIRYNIHIYIVTTPIRDNAILKRILGERRFNGREAVRNRIHYKGRASFGIFESGRVRKSFTNPMVRGTGKRNDARKTTSSGYSARVC